ncbi:hypothetical protein [Terasakiella pusilla]|uniref:hypothetical protein n=1 Tax=Terasakiella pusilla TaxID=64973 RepID=UPI003AA803B5
MRYLVFNVAVFLALAYLIVGKNQTEPRLSTLPATQEIAPLQAVEKEAPPPTPRPIAKVTPKPMASDPQVQKVEPVVEKVQAPPPLPKAIEVVKVEPKAAPSRATGKVQERDEAVAEPVAPVPSQETVLVDAKERSKQLREMVADMERMFAEKMTR